MTTVDFKLSLPDPLRKEAEAAGLLSPKAIERLLREEIRRRRVDNFFAAADRLVELGSPLLSDEEIAQEVHLARKSTAA
jgi:AraC-like DNA-binding protein